jgi:hypothetical protein
VFWECSRWLGHDVVDGNVCSNVGVIQEKFSNIYCKSTTGWIKLVLRSISFVVPHTQTLCRRSRSCCCRVRQIYPWGNKWYMRGTYLRVLSDFLTPHSFSVTFLSLGLRHFNSSVNKHTHIQ